jgi:hypothetical protein
MPSLEEGSLSSEKILMREQNGEHENRDGPVQRDLSSGIPVTVVFHNVSGNSVVCPKLICQASGSTIG